MMNCLIEIATRVGRNYITPEDVSLALENYSDDKVRLDLLEVLAKQASCGVEDYSLCAFIAFKEGSK